MKTKLKDPGFTQTLSFKLIIIGFLSLVLLIPTAWIRNIISERETRNEEVSKEISSVWSGKQIIAGPVLSIPYRTSFITDGKIYIQKSGTAHFLPEQLEINATIYTSIRYRGIFRVAVYNADIKIRGSFVPPDFTQLGISSNDAELENAVIIIGITDMRGIQKEVILNLNEKSFQVTAGSLNKHPISNGFHVKNIYEEAFSGKGYDFKIDLSLNGSNFLGFYPFGKTTIVNMTSTWPDPCFEGAFLPVSHNISKSGFNASWLVTHLNRNYPQAWLDDDYSFDDSSFGAGLFLPVNHYQKSERSLKYAIMFITLTFLLFLLIEILNRKRLHPIQYFLVGLAITIFYTLLVSLSEHLDFALAFLISSIAVISLITFYIHSNYKSRYVTLITFLILSFLYTFLFIVLQLQSYALLIGSIGLFMVLGTFMYFTRRINWYKEEQIKDQPD